MKLYYLQCKQFQFVVFGNVRWAVFRALSKYLSGKDVSPLPSDEIESYAYARHKVYIFVIRCILLLIIIFIATLVNKDEYIIKPQLRSFSFLGGKWRSPRGRITLLIPSPADDS